MFKELPIRLTSSDGNIRKPIISAAGVASLASVAFLLIANPAAAAAPSQKSCLAKYNACSARCVGRYPTSDTEKAVACINRTCAKQHDNCLASIPKGGSGGKTRTSGDPLNPKGGGTNTPPTGGTKDEPKAPPKVNDTRAPLGGGVLGSKAQPTTSGGGPILKSNGGSGPRFRSSGQR